MPDSHFIAPRRSQKCRKQTRNHGLLLLFIRLIIALFSVTSESLPYDTQAHT